MKKTIFIMIAVLAAVTVRTNASAADIGVGAMGWYSAWKMKQSGNNSDIKPTVLYGPVMTIGFDKTWSLSGVFLYGSFKMKNDGDSSSQKIRRFDADITLNRIMTPNVKVFGGAKVMNYSWSNNGSGHHFAAGPALGVGLSYPLSDSFFILYNASAMILRGTHDEQNGSKWSFWAPGYNTTLSGAYYFTSISTTLNAGLRLQYFKDICSDSENNDSHYFYGVFISAIYSF
jgi:hypothetical protein